MFKMTYVCDFRARERKVAEERMRQINEQNSRVQAAKGEQREFYMKYLRRNQQENLPLRPLQESLDDV